jgi:tRNA threonylcarbamoyl adenosine modification protein (Sua5/YciO/YrdC/YwlC family)
VRRVQIHVPTPNRRTIQHAADVLRAGGIVVYPTDTIYGLGCDITQKEAVARLYRIRDMSPKKPLAFMCRDLKHISDFAFVSNFQYRTVKRLIPGAFTFVLPASREVPKHMVQKKREVGIRVPDHPVPMALLEVLGHPIITTSCGEDPETGLPLADPDAIVRELGGKADLFLDAGYGGMEPSTVVSLLGDEVEVLRQGSGEI